MTDAVGFLIAQDGRIVARRYVLQCKGMDHNMTTFRIAPHAFFAKTDEEALAFFRSQPNSFRNLLYAPQGIIANVTV